MAAIKRSRVTKVLAAGSDYDDNDIISESDSAGTAWVFEDIGFGSGVPGSIFKVDVTCSEDSVAPALRLHLFSAVPTTSAVNNDAALAMTNADRLNYLGFIDMIALADSGEFSHTQVGNLDFGYWCGLTGNKLWGIVQLLDATTAETAGMSMTITLWARST